LKKRRIGSTLYHRWHPKKSGAGQKDQEPGPSLREKNQKKVLIFWGQYRGAIQCPLGKGDLGGVEGR